MSAQYQRFLKVLEKWPVDKTKAGRDLGENIRKQVKSLTNPSNLTSEANTTLIRQLGALERITNNTYFKKYPRTRTSTATGLTKQQCSQVLSSEFLKYLDEDSNRNKKKEKAAE